MRRRSEAGTTVIGSWQPSAATCYGIPAGSKASAVFPATLTSPVTVVCTDTFSFKDIAFKSKAGVTLRGGTVKASSPATYATGAKQVIDGMAFSAQRIAPGDAENVEIVVRNGGSYGHNGSLIYGELSSHIKVRVEGEGSTVDIRSNTAQSPSIKGSDHVWEAVDGGKLSTIYTALFSEDARFSQTRPTIRLADGGAWSTGGTFLYGTRSDADTPTVILEGRQPSFTSSLNGDALVLGTNTAASVVGKTTLRFVPPADGWAAAPMQATKGRAIIGANTSVIVDATKLTPAFGEWSFSGSDVSRFGKLSCEEEPIEGAPTEAVYHLYNDNISVADTLLTSAGLDSVNGFVYVDEEGAPQEYDITATRAVVGYKLGSATAETDPTLNGMSADDITVLAELACADNPSASVASLEGRVVPCVSGASGTVALLLCGTALGSLYSAITSILIYSDDSTLRSLYVWMLGTFNGRGWSEVKFILLPSVLAVALFAIVIRPLDLLNGGETAASSLGVNVKRLRLGVIIAGSLATSAAVCAGGTIGFVGYEEFVKSPTT